MESKVSTRLKQPLAKEVLQHLFLPRLNREFFANFEMLTQVNLAHLLMLHEQGILDHDASQRLAQALLVMQAEGPHVVELDAAREEAYFNYEAHLIKAVGQELGGRLHTARSRNDIGATIDRIRARDFAARIGAALIGVSQAALAQAERYADCVMPGYTHMQAAQPITYGYYLSALVDAWSRDIGRLAHALETADASPLGACALAGTSFPIDRDTTSALLGFSGPLANALDSVASRDFALELSATLSIMMITCSRMVQDFYIWSTPEFGYLTFPDSIASTSSIMPQKKNPAVLEYLRGKTGHLIGLTSAALSTVKSTHFTHSGDSSRESTRTCWESCEEALKALELMQLLVEQVAPNRDRMAARAADDFSTVTDLADLLVRRADASFRDAHHIIGAVVRQALEAGLPARAITPAMITSAAAEQLGRPVTLDEADIAACLDPVRNVAARQSLGGPAPQSVRAHLVEQRARLALQQAAIDAAQRRAADARGALQRQAAALAAAETAAA
ncbi:Argininosuccinate lyase [Achromobacter deleyi]|uniref:Argininosuccinate lyase n=2 Tax=Achromobacter deleyi TaxID=1353891 RepID=A0A6S7A573_9BURK|nr:argininosuccinate lyase [Achromobacter deleyi]CAB3702043.1 Argininosuccinate lyase [Achromobacter deleyi]CAB3858911.1 Argininosuccinate lyase [Achromobacter deleyi]